MDCQGEAVFPSLGAITSTTSRAGVRLEFCNSSAMVLAAVAFLTASISASNSKASVVASSGLAAASFFFSLGSSCSTDVDTMGSSSAGSFSLAFFFFFFFETFGAFLSSDSSINSSIICSATRSFSIRFFSEYSVIKFLTSVCPKISATIKGVFPC